MKNTVLLDAISAGDKEKIESYIDTFGVIKDNFIGVDKWLQFWSYSKQKLFKLLGNQLVQKFKFEYKKPERSIEEEMEDLLNFSTFKDNYVEFCYNYILKQIDANGEPKPLIYTSDDDEPHFHFRKIMTTPVFTRDKIAYSIKLKRIDNGKTLQLQEDMKPMRALSKIVSFFSDIWEFKGFEEFRVAHSRIFNEKVIKGQLCLSIHPLDFLTMSDNNSDWSSCMSWKSDGCYHLGTVEMMNSNNVICCYIESKSDPFTWEGNSDSNTYSWNNKKFRVLLYTTKDIIVNGKSYPYENIEIEKFAIEKVRELAEKNLGWTYQFGPERYLDMIHINYYSDMMRNKDWIRYGETTKHNIIFDTNAMYNDMFNDNQRQYWCYRNKVKRNKVINISGKANCLCCNKDVKMSRDYEDDYNERYSNEDSVICEACLDEKQTCYCCGAIRPTMKSYMVKMEKENYYVSICKECFKKKIRICPNCGKPYYANPRIDSDQTVYGELFEGSLESDKTYYLRDYIYWYYHSRESMILDAKNCSWGPQKYENSPDDESPFETKELGIGHVEIITLHDCEQTLEDINNNFNLISYRELWGGRASIRHEKKVLPFKIAQKYDFFKLKKVEPEDDLVIGTDFTRTYKFDKNEKKFYKPNPLSITFPRNRTFSATITLDRF